MPDAHSLPGLGIFQLARLGRSGSKPLESFLALSGALHRSALGNAFFAGFDRELESSTPAIWANPEATTPVPPVGILPMGDEALIQPAAHYVLFERDSHLVRFLSRAPRHSPPHASVGLDAPKETIPEPPGGDVRLPLPSVHGVGEMAIVIPASSHDAHGPCPGLSIDVGARSHALPASARGLHAVLDYLFRQSGNRVRMYSSALSLGSFTVPGPLLTKKSPSGLASIPFHFKNTGSGLRWQLTTHTVFP